MAILLWSTLAVLSTAARGIPPFQLVSLCFAVAFLVGLGSAALQGPGVLGRLRQPVGAWFLAVAGLFGYHFFYFVALARAPAAQASLIAYLWPLLIVLLAALLPGEKLRGRHLLGVLAGLAGTWMLVGGRGELGFDRAHLPGYLAALLCAFLWSGYSVLNRRYADQPTSAVTVTCGTTAVLAALCHGALEGWVPPTAPQWLAVLALGAGPVGLAFFAWDHGTKRGDLQALGALSYLAPVLSTGLLVAAGEAPPSWELAAACMLVTGGAAVASAGRRRPEVP